MVFLEALCEMPLTIFKGIFLEVPLKTIRGNLEYASSYFEGHFLESASKNDLRLFNPW